MQQKFNNDKQILLYNVALHSSNKNRATKDIMDLQTVEINQM
jgi:hypothetical protein